MEGRGELFVVLAYVCAHLAGFRFIGSSIDDTSTYPLVVVRLRERRGLKSSTAARHSECQVTPALVPMTHWDVQENRSLYYVTQGTIIKEAEEPPLSKNNKAQDLFYLHIPRVF